MFLDQNPLRNSDNSENHLYICFSILFNVKNFATLNKCEIHYIFLSSFVVEKLLSSVFIMNASLLINKTDLECNLLEVITVYNICI